MSKILPIILSVLLGILGLFSSVVLWILAGFGAFGENITPIILILISPLLLVGFFIFLLLKRIFKSQAYQSKTIEETGIHKVLFTGIVIAVIASIALIIWIIMKSMAI